MGGMNASLPAPASIALSRSPSSLPLLPRAPLTPRLAVWLPLLGIAVLPPAMLLSAAFPVSDHARTAFAGVAVAPGIGFLKHVLLGPILEEIIYRGLLLQLARRYMSTGLAIVLSSVVFGMTHFPGGPALVVGATLLGGMLSCVAVRTRSLYASLLCHAAFNAAIAFILAPLFNVAEKLQAVPAGGRIAAPLTTLMPAWAVALSVVTATLTIVMIVRETRCRRSGPVIPAA